MIAALFRSILRLFNWKLEHDHIPHYTKAVFIFAPHTSNWDFVTMLCVKFIWKVEIKYLGKESLFKAPFGWFFRYFGGMPVRRSESQNMVEQVCDMITSQEECRLVLAPEGTRSYTNYWKTGFYHIAHRSNVPIVMFYLDTKSRTIGYAEPFETSGDIESDFRHIAEYYRDKEGYIPENKSLIQTKQHYLNQKKQGTTHDN